MSLPAARKLGKKVAKERQNVLELVGKASTDARIFVFAQQSRACSRASSTMVGDSKI
jgi:hypothetical protein